MQTNKNTPTNLDLAFCDQLLFKKWQKIYYKLWDAEWEKNEKTFEQWIKTQPIENQKQLKVIFDSAKPLFYSMMNNKKSISTTFLDFFSKKKGDELQKELSILAFKPKEEHESFKQTSVINCAIAASEVASFMILSSIPNIIVEVLPDHAFNAFKLNNSYYFFDVWAGGIIGEFNSREFFERCNLMGCYNLKVAPKSYLRGYHYQECELLGCRNLKLYGIEQVSTKIDKYHESQFKEFKEIVKSVNNFNGKNEILIKRIKKYFSGLDAKNNSNLGRSKTIKRLAKCAYKISNDEKVQHAIRKKAKNIAKIVDDFYRLNSNFFEEMKLCAISLEGSFIPHMMAKYVDKDYPRANVKYILDNFQYDKDFTLDVKEALKSGKEFEKTNVINLETITIQDIARVANIVERANID